MFTIPYHTIPGGNVSDGGADASHAGHGGRCHHYGHIPYHADVVVVKSMVKEPIADEDLLFHYQVGV